MNCPPDDDLRRLIRDEPDDAGVIAHLDDCHPCQERLVALAGGAGTWAAVRHLSAADTSDARTTPAGSTVDSPAAPRPDPTPPPELADHPRYRILGYLGGGGMGEVWMATHTLMNKTVALKVIRPALVCRPRAVERFRQEARAAGRLNHPNVAQAHDADQIDDLHFLVMEHVAGVNLEDEVVTRGPLRVRAACDAVRQVAAALQHAHAAGVTHRDIKPSNLIRTATGVVKVLDFGIARLNELADTPGGGDDSPTRHTADGAVMGTYDFLSPEQGRNARDADKK
jgi:serine/threonine protein kinase